MYKVIATFFWVNKNAPKIGYMPLSFIVISEKAYDIVLFRCYLKTNFLNFSVFQFACRTFLSFGYFEGSTGISDPTYPRIQPFPPTLPLPLDSKRYIPTLAPPHWDLRCSLYKYQIFPISKQCPPLEEFA